MGKVLIINCGSAMLLNENSESFAAYDSVTINCGSALASRKVYEQMNRMGVSVNSGSVNVIEVAGEVVNLADKAVVTASGKYANCFLACEERLIIEDAKGLTGVTGLYAEILYSPESVDLSGVRGIAAEKRVVYRDGAKLMFDDAELDGNSTAAYERGAFYWITGAVTALDGDALETLRARQVSFHCHKLVIYNGLYEKYADMFKAESFRFVPDGYAVTGDVELDEATSPLHGDKLYVRGDLTVAYNQVERLGDFTALIVEGTATMPVNAAAAFKKVGKAKDFNLYEGRLAEINGFEIITREQLQAAAENDAAYTFIINGAAMFAGDVTVQDIAGVAAVRCNGVLSVPGHLRGAIDGKIKKMNGSIIDAEAVLKKKFGDGYILNGNSFKDYKEITALLQGGGGDETNTVNTGTFRL